MELHRRRLMKAINRNIEPIVPAGYTQVDWIYMTSRYELNYYPQEDMSLDFAFTIYNPSTTWINARPIQPYLGSANNVAWGINWYNKGVSCMNGSTISRNSGYNANNKISVKAVFGQTQTSLTLTVGSSTNVVTGTPSSRPNFNKYHIAIDAGAAPIRLYRITLYQDTTFNSVFFDLIPCKNSNDEYGFWDRLAETFITQSSWTGGFDS